MDLGFEPGPSFGMPVAAEYANHYATPLPIKVLPYYVCVCVRVSVCVVGRDKKVKFN